MTAQFAFDTRAFVKRLSAAGMDTQQAEALVGALSEHAFDDLVTTGVLRSELNELRSELRLEMKELEMRPANSLTSRMGAMIAGSTALTVAILGALIGLR